jgi:hypothetical protein
VDAAGTASIGTLGWVLIGWAGLSLLVGLILGRAIAAINPRVTRRSAIVLPHRARDAQKAA